PASRCARDGPPQRAELHRPASPVRSPRDLLRLIARPLRGWQLLALDYPVHPQSRYGHGKPPHAQLAAMVEAHRASYRETLASWAGLAGDLASITPGDAG